MYYPTSIKVGRKYLHEQKYTFRIRGFSNIYPILLSWLARGIKDCIMISSVWPNISCLSCINNISFLQDKILRSLIDHFLENVFCSIKLKGNGVKEDKPQRSFDCWQAQPRLKFKLNWTGLKLSLGKVLTKNKKYEIFH